MIRSRINEYLNVIFHESDGLFTKEDATHALVRTEELGGGQCAVIWDLRKTDADCFNNALGNSLLQSLHSKVIVPSSHCRAIVAKDLNCCSQLEHLINSLPIPWPWLVTTSIREAVVWVGHSHRS